MRRSRSIPLPEPASLTNSLKICERCRLGCYVLALRRSSSPYGRAKFVWRASEALTDRSNDAAEWVNNVRAIGDV
jgi:hypothetical protein